MRCGNRNQPASKDPSHLDLRCHRYIRIRAQVNNQPVFTSRTQRANRYIHSISMSARSTVWLGRADRPLACMHIYHSSFHTDDCAFSFLQTGEVAYTAYDRAPARTYTHAHVTIFECHTPCKVSTARLCWQARMLRLHSKCNVGACPPPFTIIQQHSRNFQACLASILAST